ncbi:hypothetical protein GCM10007862_09800 [Dyella lipolytica]|nr:hypothetical protein GCM10007862_09800 [Dyella lipolytica]
MYSSDGRKPGHDKRVSNGLVPNELRWGGGIIRAANDHRNAQMRVFLTLSGKYLSIEMHYSFRRLNLESKKMK